MSTQDTVDFSKLVAPSEINARGDKGKAGLEELAASIRAKGLIQPLTVRPSPSAPGKFEVIDGRRRHQALALLVKSGDLDRKLAKIPVVIRDEGDADALETSLMANVVRLPMHAVDQHKVMARLVDGGATVLELAARFGISARTVQQHLALGNLAPEVLEAWKAGKIGPDEARAFAGEADKAKQAALLKRLGRNVQAWHIKQEIGRKRTLASTCAALQLVGEKAYTKAGGRIEEDLFDDKRYALDVDIAESLAAPKLEARCNELLADGWSWARLRSAVANPWHFDNVRDDVDGDDPDAFTPEDKARSGCLVGLAFKGGNVVEIVVDAGLVEPAGNDADLEDSHDQAAAESRPAEDEAEAGGPFDISQALLETITAAQTAAAAKVLERDRDLALRVAIAALEAGGTYDSPAKLSIGHEVPHKPMNVRGFANVFSSKSLDGAVLPVLADRFAKLVAASVFLTVRAGCRQIDAAGVLIDALDAGEYLAEMRAAFAPDDYFKRAKKETAIAAAEEMHAGGHHFGIMSREDLERMKKAALAIWTAEQATACGWLPPELRCSGYALITPPAAKGKAKGGRK